MTNVRETAVLLQRPTLAFTGTRAMVFQLLMIAAAVMLPAAAHLTGIPVRVLVPMHWPVILAGLVYGWRAGALTGLLAPAVNYLITGYPLPPIIPSMTVELMTYGITTGFFREILRRNSFVSVAAAVVAGRIVFASSIILWNVYTVDLAGYFRAALIPGIAAACIQIAFLPAAARWWIRLEQKKPGA